MDALRHHCSESGLKPPSDRERPEGWSLAAAFRLWRRRSTNDDGFSIHQGCRRPIASRCAQQLRPLGCWARGTSCHGWSLPLGRTGERPGVAATAGWPRSATQISHHGKEPWPGLASIPGWRPHMLLKARQVGELSPACELGGPARTARTPVVAGTCCDPCSGLELVAHKGANPPAPSNGPSCCGVKLEQQARDQAR